MKDRLRNLLLLVIAALVLAGLASCKGGTDESAETPGALQFAKTDVDLGEVFPDPKGSNTVNGLIPVEFPVSNPSKKTVEIAEIHAGCGCTTAGTSPKSLAPGEESTITMLFTPDYKRATHHVDVTVKTKEPAPHVYSLSFQLDLIPVMYWETLVVDLGDVDAAKGGSGEVSLYSFNPDEPVEFTRMYSLNDVLKVTYKGHEPFTDDAGREGVRHIFELHVPPDLGVSEYKAEVVVRTADDQLQFPPLTARWASVSDIGFEPKRLFVRLAPGENKQEKVTLRSNSGKAFTVSDIEKGKELPAEVRLAEGDTSGEKSLLFDFDSALGTGGIMSKVSVRVRPDGADKDITLEIPVMTIIHKDS